MMVRARVTEIMTDGTSRNRGDHDFAALPRSGDRIVLGNERGDLEMLRTVRIKHVPIHVPATKVEGKAPIAVVYVEWVEEWNERI